MAMHESGQMHLEAIYVLLQKNDKIRAIDIGAYLWIYKAFRKPWCWTFEEKLAYLS